MADQMTADSTSRKRLFLIGGGVVVAAIAAWLAFGFFGIQAAFIDDTVDEGGPVFASGAGTEDDADAASADNTEAEQDAIAETEEFQEAMEEAEANPTEAEEEDPMPAEIVTLASGQFSGESRYTVVGTASVLNDGSEQRFLRFEGFESNNGPDLKVYLRADDGDFINLGELKGNIGDQNYEIPTDVDLSVYDTVQIWCERFGVNFGFAELA
ncbi:MAG: DM13 domain-containing protein [Actinomycetota bacterium]